MNDTSSTEIIDTSGVPLDLPVDEIPKVMVWVDEETTGLNPDTDRILELGVIITDYDLNILNERKWYIKDVGWEEALEANPFVKEMHDKSGLTAELLSLPELRTLKRMNDGSGNYPLAGVTGRCGWGSIQASHLAYVWLTQELKLPEGVYPMCGSSVHFDRKFAEVHLPILNSFFHYRNIDISTLKELCKILNPDLYSRIYSETGFDKANAVHRVLPDIRETLREAEFYFDNFLFIQGDASEYEEDENQLTLPGM